MVFIEAVSPFCSDRMFLLNDYYSINFFGFSREKCKIFSKIKNNENYFKKCVDSG